MNRILVARFGAIGDVLMATPTLRALSRQFPDARITHLVGKGLGDVLSGIPYLHEIIEFDRKADIRPTAALRLARRLRAERFDLYVNLQDSVKTRLIGAASGAKTRLRYRKIDGPAAATGREIHAIDNYLQTLVPLGIDPAACDRHLDFFVPDAATESVKNQLASLGVATTDTLVIVNPGASVATRQWPAPSLAALLNLLDERHPDWKIALSGAGSDRQVADAALPGVRRPDAILDLIGKTRLKETGALYRRADCVVTMNTGPLHLAAAVGAPIVTLFGAWSEDRTGPAPPPPNARRQVLPMVLSQVEGLDCAPCMAKTCRRGDLACLLRIGPTEVLDAVEAQLSGAGR